VPPQDLGLLARLDALVELAADRHGLALAAGGRLAAAEARAAARAAGLTSTARGPTPRGPAARGSALALRDAVELLRAVGEGSGCCGSAATGWRRPACATPGPRSTRACGPAWSTPPGASKRRKLASRPSTATLHAVATLSIGQWGRYSLSRFRRIIPSVLHRMLACPAICFNTLQQRPWSPSRNVLSGLQP
jgi:hypothetical protein